MKGSTFQGGINERVNLLRIKLKGRYYQKKARELIFQGDSKDIYIRRR